MDLAKLLEGCTATDVAGIAAHIATKATELKVKVLIDDGDKSAYVPKSKYDGIVSQLTTANETLADYKKDVDNLETLTKDNKAAQETIATLNSKLASSQGLMQKVVIRSAFAEKVAKEGFILPVDDLMGFIKSENLKVNDDGTVLGVEQEISALKASKPYLLKKKGDAGDEGDDNEGNEGDNDDQGNTKGGTGKPGKPNMMQSFGGKGYKAGAFGKMLGEQVKADTAQNSLDSFFSNPGSSGK